MLTFKRKKIFTGMLSLCLSVIMLLVVLVAAFFGVSKVNAKDFDVTVKAEHTNSAVVDNKNKILSVTPENMEDLDLSSIFEIKKGDVKVSETGKKTLSLSPETKTVDVKINRGKTERIYQLKINYENILFIYRASKTKDGSVASEYLGYFIKKELVSIPDTDRFDIFVQRFGSKLPSTKTTEGENTPLRLHTSKQLITEFNFKNTEQIKNTQYVFAHSLVRYQLDIWFQKVEGNEYALEKTLEYKYGEVGETVSFPEQTLEGVEEVKGHQDAVTSGVLEIGKDLVLKRFYNRKEYTISFYTHSNPGAPLHAITLKVRHGAKIDINKIQYEIDAITSSTSKIFKGVSLEENGVLINLNDYYVTDPNQKYHLVFVVGEADGKIDLYFQELDKVNYKKVELIIRKLGIGTIYEVNPRFTNTENIEGFSPNMLEGFKFVTKTKTLKESVTRIEVKKNANQNVFSLYYDREVYRIEFDAQGDLTTINPGAVDVMFGDHVPEPTERPKRINHVFKYWSTSELSTSDKYDFNKPVSASFKLYGIWEQGTEASYRIEYYLESSQHPGEYLIDSVNSKEIIGKLGSNVTIPDRVYDGFTKFNHPDTILNGVVVVDNSLVLKAYYNRIEYTLYFNTDNLDPDTQNPIPGSTASWEKKVKFGYRISEPTSPTKDSKTKFLHWENVEKQKIDFNVFTMPSHDVILTAKYASIVCELKIFHFLEKQTVTEPKQYEEISASFVSIPDVLYGPIDLSTHVKTFTGFELSPESTAILNYTVTEEENTQTVKLYYNRKLCRVTYNANGGDFHVNPNDDLTKSQAYFGNTVEAPVSNAVKKDGETFVFWSINQSASYLDFDQQFSFGTPLSGDIVLFAIWKPESGISYRIEHYTPDPETDVYRVDKTELKEGTTGEEVTANHLSQYLDNGFEIFNHPDQVLSGHVLGNSSLVLKLYYRRKLHTVKFETRSDATQISDIKVKFGAHIPQNKLPDPASITTTDGHFKFEYWFLKEDGSETQINFSEFVMPNETVTLKAKFKQVKFKLTIKHSRENLSNGAFDESDTQTKFVSSGAHTLVPNNYTGFEPHESNQGSISVVKDTEVELKYKRRIYIISYDPQGGHFKSDLLNPNKIDTLTKYKYEKPLVNPGNENSEYNPEKEYTNFSHWSNTPGGAPFEFDKPVTKTITLYAVYNITHAQYKVEYHLQVISGTGYTRLDEDTTSHIGAVAQTVHATIKEFTGFNHVVIPESKEDGEVLANGTLVLKVYYDRVTFEITFDTNGSSATVPSQNVRYQGTVEEPNKTLITKPGFTLLHWEAYVPTDLVNPKYANFNFATAITEKLVLKIKWGGNAISYTIKIKLEKADHLGEYANPLIDQGTHNAVSGEITVVNYSDLSAQIKNEIETKGYNPKWVKAEGPQILHTELDPNTSILIDPSKPGYNPGANEIILTFNFKRFAIEFDLQGGEANDAFNTQTVAYNKLVSDPAIPVVKPGHTFTHFSKEPSGAAYVFSTPVTETFKLFAVYTTNKYQITFDAQGGAPVPEMHEVDYDSTIAAPSPEPTKVGHNFICWTKDTSTNVPFKFGEDLIKNSFTLYAVWEKKIYTVRFLGFNDVPFVEQKIKFNEFASEPNENPTQYGWEFKHFSKTKNGDKFAFNSTPIIDHITLYSVWVEQIDVVFHTLGGKINGSSDNYQIKVSRDDNLVDKTPVITRNNYTFKGWSKKIYETGTSNLYDLNNPVGLVNLNLYPVFELSKSPKNYYPQSKLTDQEVINTLNSELVQKYKKVFSETINSLNASSLVHTYIIVADDNNFYEYYKDNYYKFEPIEIMELNGASGNIFISKYILDYVPQYKYTGNDDLREPRVIDDLYITKYIKQVSNKKAGAKYDISDDRILHVDQNERIATSTEYALARSVEKIFEFGWVDTNYYWIKVVSPNNIRSLGYIRGDGSYGWNGIYPKNNTYYSDIDGLRLITLE